ncbi:MAG: hypothetical protein M1819_000516 [Sarea resinae]|nr:MAG: hypothetical protein M1819_000516 [Sarea resinae]
MSRRTNEALNNGRNPARSVSPPAPGRSNGHSAGVTSRRSHTPPSGFVAVNTRRLSNLDDISHGSDMAHAEATSGASPATHAELLTKFLATRGRSIGNPEVDHRRSSFSSRLSIDPAPVTSTSALPSKGFDASEYATVLLNSASPVPLSATPPALPPPPRPVVERDDGGPFKVEMVARMEHLARGDRIIPPCDRCRRLHMDCLKNLTACTGCTKKHAKCSWKDVQEEELTGDGEEEPHEGSNSEAHEDGQDEPGEARDTSVGLTSSGAVQEADKEPGEEGALGESKGNEEVHHGNGNTISNGDSKAKK